jgi:hypothetical protein
VGEFVREQAPPMLGLGSVLAGAENDVLAEVESKRIERLGVLAFRVNADVSEIMAEGRLEKEASLGLETPVLIYSQVSRAE